jgi:glutamine amidotransferase
MATIGVIDYGMGNLHSMTKALARVAPEDVVEVGSDPEQLSRTDRLVFPGVGGIRYCMDELQRLELHQMLLEYTERRPLLGVCVGLQALLRHSDENEGTNCLGLFPGDVVRFPDNMKDAAGRTLKVPHMGWNRVHQTRAHPLWAGVGQDSSFYFVHSFYVRTEAGDQVLGCTEYGHEFASVLLRRNVVAVQFHLEKSQNAGLAMLANFVHWDGTA